VLLTRNGHDWSGRYPWITESALKNGSRHFVIDGEAVVLGVDGVADFDALYSRKSDDQVQLYAFDCMRSMCWRSMAMISGPCLCRCARRIWRGCSGAGPMESS
jgi:hypothetical protein